MELQQNRFWMLKGHGAINCIEAYWVLFVQQGFEISKCMSSLPLLPTEIFAVFETNFFFNITQS